MVANYVQLLDCYGNSLAHFSGQTAMFKILSGIGGVCPAPGYTMKCRAAPHVVVFSVGLPSTVEIQHQSVV
jgi:hypothetical protein